MSSADQARAFFAALENERWREAVRHLSTELMESHRETIRFRLEGLRERYVAEAGLELPDDDIALFALWLAKSDYRAEAQRELEQARFENPDQEWRIVGGIPPLDRRVVGELLEAEDRAIIVYRLYGGRGRPSALEFVRENGLPARAR